MSLVVNRDQAIDRATAAQHTCSTRPSTSAPVGTGSRSRSPTASHWPASPARDAVTYSATSAARTTADVTGIVVPDSSVTSPVGNSAHPTSSPTTATTIAATSANDSSPPYFTSSRRV